MFLRWVNAAYKAEYRTEAGWQFELLRTLPPADALRVYRYARAAAHAKIQYVWWWWMVCCALVLVVFSSFALCWWVAAFLGLGLGGRVLADIAFHIVLCWFFLHPLARRINRLALPFVRVALADELLRYAATEVFPAPRPRRRRRAA